MDLGNLRPGNLMVLAYIFKFVGRIKWHTLPNMKGPNSLESAIWIFIMFYNDRSRKLFRIFKNSIPYILCFFTTNGIL